MIEAIEYATPRQLEQRRRIREIRQTIAAKAVPDDGIDLKRKPRRVTTQPPEPVEAARAAPQSPCVSPAHPEPDDLPELPTVPFNFIDHIKKIVAREFKQTVSDLSSLSHEEKYVTPRHIAMYFCRTLALKSYPAIAQRFGGRDHTTAMNAVNRITGKMLTDVFVCQTVVELQSRLEADLMSWRQS